MPSAKIRISKMELADKFDTVDLKVRQLAKNLERLRQDNAILLDENQQLRELLARQQDRVSVLKDKLEQIQREVENDQVGQKQSMTALRNQLVQYLKELDTCIEWVQNS